MREEQIISSVFQFSPRFAPREDNKHFFPQYHATAISLQFADGQLHLAYQLTISNYHDIEHLTDFPRTQRIRSGHAFGDHVVKRGNFQTIAQSVINLSRHTCVIRERRELCSMENNFVLIVRLHSSIVFELKD